MRSASRSPTVPDRMRRDHINELERAIDHLPMQTRTAMLDGIRANPIIVGAYTDDKGGICPMLAAHRNGGRTTLLAFAHSWDRFADTRRVRNASRRELAVLERLLTSSLDQDKDNELTDLGAAIAAHKDLTARRMARRRPPAPEQISAARLTPGRVRGLRPRRANADAERALAHLDQHVLALTP